MSSPHLGIDDLAEVCSSPGNKPYRGILLALSQGWCFLGDKQALRLRLVASAVWTKPYSLPPLPVLYL